MPAPNIRLQSPIQVSKHQQTHPRERALRCPRNAARLPLFLGAHADVQRLYRLAPVGPADRGHDPYLEFGRIPHTDNIVLRFWFTRATGEASRCHNPSRTFTFMRIPGTKPAVPSHSTGSPPCAQAASHFGAAMTWRCLTAPSSHGPRWRGASTARPSVSRGPSDVRERPPYRQSCDTA